jgi:hypothetical protein
MGQAAGTATALALEHDADDMRTVDVAELRRELSAAGMQLDPARHEPFAPVTTPNPEDAD